MSSHFKLTTPQSPSPFLCNPLFLLLIIISLHPPTSTSELPASASLRVLFLCCWRTDAKGVWLNLKGCWIYCSFITLCCPGNRGNWGLGGSIEKCIKCVRMFWKNNSFNSEFYSCSLNHSISCKEHHLQLQRMNTPNKWYFYHVILYFTLGLSLWMEHYIHKETYRRY